MEPSPIAVTLHPTTKQCKLGFSLSAIKINMRKLRALEANWVVQIAVTHIKQTKFDPNQRKQLVKGKLLATTRRKIYVGND